MPGPAPSRIAAESPKQRSESQDHSPETATAHLVSLPEQDML